MLSQQQGKILVKLAKQIISKDKIIIPDRPFLKLKRGVFVTLMIKNKLRGCMGLPYPTNMLGEAVTSAAKSAAYSDPRFPSITKQELIELEIEVSVLSKPTKTTLKDIKKGDGIILEFKGRSSLFLPQVWEQLPKKEQFLEELAIKAMLAKNDYKQANYQKFSVQIFK